MIIYRAYFAIEWERDMWDTYFTTLAAAKAYVDSIDPEDDEWGAWMIDEIEVQECGEYYK